MSASGGSRPTHLVEVGDDLVEEAETFHAHVVPVQLDVKVVEVGDGGEEHAHLSVGLVVQVLRGRNQCNQSFILSVPAWPVQLSSHSSRCTGDLWPRGRGGSDVLEKLSLPVCTGESRCAPC